jgi:hypothetical protein
MYFVMFDIPKKEYYSENRYKLSVNESRLHALREETHLAYRGLIFFDFDILAHCCNTFSTYEWLYNPIFAR